MIIQSTSTRPILTVQRSIPLVPSLARITIKNPRSSHPNGLSPFSTSSILNQRRERLRTGAGKLPIFRFCLDDEDRFFNLSNIRSTPSSNDTVKIESDSKRDSKVDHQSYWVGIPPDAVDKSLTRKLKRVEGVHQRDGVDRIDPVEVRKVGEDQLSIITERWVRDELNVMGTIREETIQIFMKLILHPSTLAPLAEELRLLTDGRDQPKRASMIAPNRLVPPFTHADLELCQLLQYFIGSIYLSLPGGSTTQSSFYQKFESYVIHLLKNGLSHTTAQKLLVRASQLSGQAVIGIRKGHSRAELRVAQLSIWGQRRSKKLESLMVEGGDESKSHIRRLRIRKVELLKQRWRDEEIKMVRWRNRLIKVSAVREAEELAERLFREEHAQRVEEWKRSRSVEGVKEEAGRGAIANGVIDRALSFWRRIF